MMLSMVTFVSTLVAIFAAGYMAGDPGYPRFFACVGLFVSSMTGLVLSNNYLLTYVFWEGVGMCSYLLVGFWHYEARGRRGGEEGVPGQPGRRLRVRDRDLLDVDGRAGPRPELRERAELGDARASAARAVLGIALLLFWAATAKSAQVPLYVWLPDAMEGPTPGLGPDPRRDDGHGGRLPDRALDPADRASVPEVQLVDRDHRLRDRLARRRRSP